MTSTGKCCLAALSFLLLNTLALRADPVTITNSVVGQGLVLGTGTFESGTSVTLRAVPQVDWKFDHWEGVSEDLATNNPIPAVVTFGLQPKAVFVEFQGFGRFKGGSVKVFGGNISGTKKTPTGLDQVLSVSSSPSHILALRADGTVVSWGANSDGQTNVPIGLSNVVSTAAGGRHSLALKSDGTVVGWGRNENGQANPPTSLRDVVMVAAGGDHSVALRSDGTVVAWGANNYGQCSIPRGLSNVVHISVGEYHNLVVCRDGTIVSWGYNGQGQTIIPDYSQRFEKVAAGWYHSLAVRFDGSVVGWGDNRYGKASPPPDLKNVVSIQASYRNSVALDASGRAWSWGENITGESIPNAESYAGIAAGQDFTVVVQPNLELPSLVHRSPEFTIAESGSSVFIKPLIVGNGDRVWCRDDQVLRAEVRNDITIKNINFSESGSYRLVFRSPETSFVSEPSVVCVYRRNVVGNGAVLVRDLGFGRVRFSAAASKGFKFERWEGSLSGVETDGEIQFDSKTTTAVLTAIFVEAKDAKVQVEVSGKGIVTGGGDFYERERVSLLAAPELGWEFDRWEGVDQSLEKQNPIVVEASQGLKPKAIFNPKKGAGYFKGGKVIGWGSNLGGQINIPESLDKVIAIAAGGYHSLALTRDGLVLGWGQNNQGQINIPQGLRGVVSIAAGAGHSLALKSDGTVIGWGNNGYGQASVPPNLGGVIAIAAGGYHNIALKSDGGIVGWGRQDYGLTNIPLSFSNVVAIAAGNLHSLAVSGNGAVAGWGFNLYGQIDFPKDLGEVITVSCGMESDHSLALKSDGTVMAWGYNAFGQARVPVDLREVIAISATGHHNLAVKRDGSVVAWGYNKLGETVVPANLDGVFSVAAGYEFSLALRAEGGVGVIRVPEAARIIEEGSAFSLSAQFAGATSYQWFRNGKPITNSLSPWLTVFPAKVSDGGLYQLLAVSDGAGVVTVPSVVKVLPVGTPRILINGKEVVFSHRSGDLGVIGLHTSLPNGQIFYTLDGSTPGLDATPYNAPFTVTNSVVLRAFAISGDFTQEATNEPVSIQIVPTFTLATPVVGKGRVDRSPGLDRILQDDVVSVSAVPEEGWRFVRWEEDLSGSFPERNVALGRDKVVRAVFEAIPRFPLTTVAKGGSITGGGSLYQGSQITLSASPAANWTFLNWSGDYVGTETNFSWVVDGPATFEARFGTAVGTLATGPGRILLEPDLPLYPYGSQVKVIPVPDAGNALALWGEAGTGQPKTEWVLTVTNGAPRVTALFRALAADKVALTIQSTLGGRVTQPSPDGLYAKGSSVSLTAVPDSGYEFVSWSGDASGTALAVNLTLDTSKTVRAEFRRAGVPTHPLTLTVEGPGTVRRIPDLGAYEVGSDVELVAEPSTDVAFLGWSGAVTSTQRRVRVTITGPLSVQALFRPIHPVVTEVRGEGQVLLSPPDGRYMAGTELALTAKPAEGWGFVQWSGDLSTTGQEATLTVDAPKRLIAEFARLGTVTTRVMGSGTISKTPDAPSYLPGTALTLKAVPQAGWKFVRWTGGATGTNAELQVLVGRTEAIVAEFTDGEPPVLAVLEPQSGTVTSEKFRLQGTATDNVGGLSVGWTWNGVPQAALKLNEGAFETDQLTLKVGENRLELTARDGAANENRVVREVIWTPVRTLAVGTAPEAQEGKRLVFPVTLSAPGDVGGVTFQLRYDPALLADPQFEWGALVGQSVNNLNLSTPGEIGASFSLAGLALPEGTQPVATVSFRARSVPGLTNATLTPVIGSLATPTGSGLTSGNAAVAGEGRILPRKIRGDNNANQRIDVGDAVVISRLQLALDEVRPWDVPLNDLNDTGTIDNGDVIKALRIVVGLDLQPTGAPRGGEFREEGALGSELSVESRELREEGVTQLSTLNSQPRRSLRLAGANTNDVLGLEFPDGAVAEVGKPFRVIVKLVQAGAPISGASFTLSYPSAFQLVQKEVGAVVPSDALPLWGEVSGGVNLAAIRSTLWPSGSGVMAVVTLMPTDQIQSQPTWPVALAKGEVTGAGFDIRGLDDVRGEIRTQTQPPVAPKVGIPSLAEGGPLAFDIEAGAGAAIVLETTTDLSSWTEDRRLTGQGPGKPVRVSITPDPTARARFWRVRVP